MAVQTPSKAPRTLSPEQVDHFLEHGYIRLQGCFSRAKAAEWLDAAFTDSGWSQTDPATWPGPVQRRVRNGDLRCAQIKTFAPKVWAAATDLLGGEERIEQPALFGAGFICTFPQSSDGQSWVPPSPAATGWHKDGFFKHFLDSNEQGLLSIVLWSDIQPQGGGTFIAPDSIGIVARAMAERPDGMEPAEFCPLINECKRFVEVTGEIGDVFIMHPFMLHAPSRNHSSRVRIISNPPISLWEPVKLDRPDSSENSILERSILQAIGKERFEYKVTADRARRRPDGSLIDMEAERKRLWSIITE